MFTAGQTDQTNQQIGRVLAIAVRSDHRGPMIEVNQAETYANGCLAGDHGSSAERGITLLASRQWQQVIQQLGVDLPWHTRRANLLIEANTLKHLIGKTIRIGHVRVDVKAETKPCRGIDQWHNRASSPPWPPGAEVVSTAKSSIPVPSKWKIRPALRRCSVIDCEW